MPINKRKLLDAARKHAQKGAKQRALKEYNKLVQADPRDAKLLLEIGDAYRRWGQAEEAIAQYTRVAHQYEQDGFDARAVAVLKQILNLDPKRHAAHASLADLYQRMGLDSDAVAALRTAADGYYREGRRKEALELLRKMAALDPSNTTSRFKVAELLHQEGMDGDAVTEYREIIEELRRQGASEQVCVVQERILELRPDDVAVLTALARSLSDLGSPERAETFAVRALERSRDPEQFELLAGIYKSLGNDTRLAEVTRELASYYKGRGEDDRAREALQRLPPESILESSPLDAEASEVDESELDESEVDESEVEEDELIDDEDFLVTDATDQSQVELLPHEPDGGAAAGADLTEHDLPEGDPEQLLAEASVYLRYGKRAQAIASLRSVLAQEAEHRAALEMLGEACAEDGREDDAIGCWKKAAEIAHAEGDTDSFGGLRERIGALDAQAAAEMEPLEPTESAVEPAEAVTDEEAEDSIEASSDFDFEIHLSGAEEEAAALPGAGQAGEADFAEDGIEDQIGIEVDVDLEADGYDEAAPVEMAPEQAVEIDSDGAAVDPPGAIAEVIDEIVEEAIDEVAEEAREETTPDASAAGQSTTTAEQVRDDLGEAEFYLQQGFQGEAEAIYRRILSLVPNHPTALLKLGELAAERGEDPGDVTDPGFVPEPDEGDRALADDASAGFDIGMPADDADARPQEAIALADDVEVEFDDDSAPFEIDVTCEADEPIVEDEWSADELEPDEPRGPELSDDLAAVLAEAEAAVEATVEETVEATAEPDVSSIVESTPRSIEIDLSEPEPEPEPFAAEPEVGFEDVSAQDLAGQFGDESTEVEAVGASDAPLVDEVFPAEPVQAEPPAALADDTVPMADAAEPLGGDALADSSSSLPDASEDTFDLVAELADVFEAANAPEAPEEVSAGSTVEDGFESIFADFKKGVSATLDEGDHETRFDLGIAYREMGLWDDAISEFSACLGSAERKLESLHMMALCAQDLGRYADAVSHLEQALAGADLPAAQVAALQFDLGRAQRGAGDGAAARRAFETVEELDAGFPGLADQLVALEQIETSGDGPVELAEPQEQLETFADIMDDDEPEPERFESFDDVISEVEMADEEADPEPRASRPVRKKKISFV